jgi:sugar/nucleoside kinase (ribokinase family)
VSVRTDPGGPRPLADGRVTRLLHLGNVVADVVLAVAALPEPGADVLASRATTAAGGGFNVMSAAVRQGLPAAYGGAHGAGPFATLARAALAAEGIEVLLPAKAGLDSGFVVTFVDARGERTFVTSPGAEAALDRDDLAAVTAAPGDAVYLSGYGLVHEPNRAALLSWLQPLGEATLVVFDPGPLAGSIPAGVLGTVLGRTGWLTCNALEAAQLTGAAGARESARLLAQRVRRGRVIVRLGPAGCLLAGPAAGPLHVPGFPVTAVDTTGAGDTHTGSFLAALADGEDIMPALRRANAAAALSVTRRGPGTAPTRAELARFLAHSAPARP